MAAEKDTPAARQRREKASEIEMQQRGPDGRYVAAHNGSKRVRFGRRVGSDEVVSLVASAERIDLNDKRAMQSAKRRRQAWQSEAWDYVDEVAEIGYTTTFIGNMLSKLRLFAATRPDTKEGPVPVEDAKSGVDPSVANIAIETLERLRSEEGGQSALLRAFAINLEVAGECYLHGTEDPDTGDESWNIRSVDELVIEGDEFALRLGPGQKMLDPIPSSDVVIRLWERHPRWSMLATCAMRRVLTEAEALLLLSREVRAESKSRLSNGFLLLPNELSFGQADPTRDAGDGEATDDPFIEDLQQAMIVPIQEEGSAGAVVPILIQGPGDMLQYARHLVVAKPLDATLDSRIEARIIRIARGLNMPVEVTTGLMSTTFANASQIKTSEFEDHLEPRAVLICDAWTAGYFQPALVDAGVDPDTARDIFIWFDATDLVVQPDPADLAEKAHEDGIISDAARRRYSGFTEADAPTDDEVVRRQMLAHTRTDPFIYAQMLKQSGLMDDIMIPAPVAGVIIDPGQAAPVIVGGPTPTAKAQEVGGPPEDIPPPAPPPAPIIHQLPPAPAAPDGKPVQPALPPAPVVPADKTADGDKPAGTVTASATPDWSQLGPRLVGIDRALRSRITVALDQAMRRSLERAGSRIKARSQRDKGGAASAVQKRIEGVAASAVASTLGAEFVAAAGLTDGELLAGSFEAVVDDVMEWIAGGQRQARSALESVTGSLSDNAASNLDRNQAAGLALAKPWLGDAMTRIAGRRLYEPAAQHAAGESDPSLTVPASVARATVGLAGGSRPKHGEIPLVAAAWVDVGPLVGDDGGPMGGVGTGPDLMDAAGAMGGETEGYIWQYGGAERTPFPPHEALDGFEFSEFDDPGLANDGDWPETAYFLVGDHDGCVCDIEPVMIATANADTPPAPDEGGDQADNAEMDTAAV